MKYYCYEPAKGSGALFAKKKREKNHWVEWFLEGFILCAEIHESALDQTMPEGTPIVFLQACKFPVNLITILKSCQNISIVVSFSYNLSVKYLV